MTLMYVLPVMTTVMHEEPLDPSLLELDDDMTW